MTAVQRLFFGLVVFLVFMAGGFAAGAGEREKVDELTGETAWIMGKASGKMPPDRSYCGRKENLCYPATLDTKPDISSPHTTLDAVEIVTAFMKDGKYALIPVTVENGKPLNYAQRQWGKGRQLEVDTGDFPTLARTGLHSEAELNRTKTITGRSTVEIAELGRPGRSSGAGFMGDDEDIISVIKGDNCLVERLGLRHPQTRHEGLAGIPVR
jgi:hypothetical protein